MNMKDLLDNVDVIAYRPAMNKHTGGALQTILLQQILYYFINNSYKEFYKFKEPCKKSKLYKQGDSWTEKLGFTRSQFDNALKSLKALGLVTVRIDANRLTWFSICEDLITKILVESQSTKPVKLKTSKPSYTQSKQPYTAQKQTKTVRAPIQEIEHIEENEGTSMAYRVYADNVTTPVETMETNPIQATPTSHIQTAPVPIQSMDTSPIQIDKPVQTVDKPPYIANKAARSGHSFQPIGKLVPSVMPKANSKVDVPMDAIQLSTLAIEVYNWLKSTESPLLKDYANPFHIIKDFQASGLTNNTLYKEYSRHA